MRMVAEQLKVGTMSLYTHVPGKGELTDLMFDSVYGDLYADVDEPARQSGGWRGALEFIAQRNWDVLTSTRGSTRSRRCGTRSVPTSR